MKIILSFILTSLFFISCKPAKTEASAAESAKPYPSENCLVSGEKLGEMGKPYEIVHEG